MAGKAEEEAEELFLEVEEDDKVKKGAMSKAQEEVKKAGMLPYSEPEWRDMLVETLIDACAYEGTELLLYFEEDEKAKRKTLADPLVDIQEYLSEKLLEDEETEETIELYIDVILEEVEKAAKATCFVLRRPNSSRDDPKRRRGGNGTGLLLYPLYPKSRVGWLVITNNHVIMNEEEAETAEVIFDFNVDGNKAETRKFCVSNLVSKDLPTENAQDLSKLDFSVLALECDEDGDRFLKEHATMLIDVSGRVNAASMKDIADMERLAFRPMIAFSHARGLAKRLSIGKYPKECQECPVAHIKHTLPTARGSSGANLIYPLSSTRESRFQRWKSAFVHYRHGRAVAWQAIGPMIGRDLHSA